MHSLMSKSILLFLTLVLLASCKKDTANDPENNAAYFPRNDAAWETQSRTSLGWNEAALEDLKTFLRQKNTRSFMILVNGRIAVEEYFNGHTATTAWQWNSAGKTLLTATVGIAQQEGLLRINNSAAQYLGAGWTSAPPEKEAMITPKHLLSMTSGLNDQYELVRPATLTYLADAGTRWSYHNVFQKLMDVVESAANQKFETYFNTRLRNKIGMEGFWANGVIFRIYHSNTRSMARFGLLALHKGKWNNEQVVDEAFFKESIAPSQNINPSYGYLWWLNGKDKHMVPGSQATFGGALVPNAPAGMFAAMGAEDQRLYVVPEKNMVVVRLGEVSDPANPRFAVSGFDAALWEKINAVIR